MEGKKALMKIGDFAERLGISIPHAYRLAQTGEIPCVRLGKRAVRFDQADVEAYIEARRECKPADGNAA